MLACSMMQAASVQIPICIVHRWKQAHDAGKAPKIFLEATDAKALDTVPLELLKQYAVEDVQ